MAVVRLLPDRVANQIAAGEVIERPAAVVKELVENALDAGATRIEVEFRHGGRSLMRVEDNGRGMGRDDALMSLERHATSKIKEAADLDRLGTYGFRGEALPSIASVSRFCLQTREAGAEVGTEILVNGGKFVHVRDCGRPVGTRVEVTHLFNSVPARRKFLKSDRTESAHIIQSVRLYALACPQTAFTLIEEGRTLFRSPECATLAERVAEIFGRQVAEDLLPIEAEVPGLRLRGLVGRPGAGRPTRHEMITFVNTRPVESRVLHYALLESYHESLPKGRYPLAFVFFDLDPAAVDVNVHPTKREVRFRHEPDVRQFILRAVTQRLRARAAETAPAEAPPAARPVAFSLPRALVPPVSLPREAAVAGIAWSAPPPSGSPAGRAATASQPPSRPSSPEPTSPATPPAEPPSSLPPTWRFLGLAHGSYALFETRAGLLLLDRRAALERIWFERLETQLAQGGVPRQRLLLPVPVEFDPVSSALLLDKREFLEAHGLEVLEFGRHFFRIEAVPGWMDPGEAEAFLRELVGAFREGRVPEGNAALAREALARMAAARAVRLPETVSDEAMRTLVGELFATRTPFASPQGRLTYIELSHGELARRFQK